MESFQKNESKGGMTETQAKTKPVPNIEQTGKPRPGPLPNPNESTFGEYFPEIADKNPSEGEMLLRQRIARGEISELPFSEN